MLVNGGTYCPPYLLNTSSSCVFTYVAAVSADGANLYIVNDSDNTLHLHTPEQATYVSYVTIACVINSKHRYNHIDGCGCN